jgi:hypothetical protein
MRETQQMAIFQQLAKVQTPFLKGDGVFFSSI